MSDRISEIRERIQQIAGTYKPGDVAFVAEVTTVTDTDCTVKLGELELIKVRLFSQATEAGNILFKPKVGSMVTVADFSSGKLRDLQVISCDKITLIKFVENGLTIEIDSETKKLDIKNDQVGMKDLFQAIADIVKQLTVSTPAGPSGTPLPPTLASVTQFETDFKLLLK